MIDELKEQKGIHVTRRGVAIRLCLFSPVLQDKVRASVEFPAVPIYEAETAGGGKEEHEYTADMIETDEEREMWAEYTAKRVAAELMLYERLGKLALVRGTEVDIPDGWQEEQALFGLDVPDDPTERKLHYLETEAVESNQDLSELILAILRYQSATEEERAAAADSFKSPLEGDAAREAEDEQGAVESE